MVMKRRNYRRRNYRRKGRKLNERQKLQVKRIAHAGEETKIFLATVARQPVVDPPSGAFLQTITTPTQGDGDTQRIGDRISAKRLYIRAGFDCTAAISRVRFIVFQWKPSTFIAPPLIGNILLGGSGGGAQDIFSQYNHDTRSMYKILFDKTMNFTLGAHTMIRDFSIILKPKNSNLQFNNGATTGTNQIFVLVYSDQLLASAPDWQMAIKFMFTDA